MSPMSEDGRPLSDLINIATRSVHTQLNKLVVGRLPLTLPPQAHDASQYVSGLLHIAPVYIAFESLWRSIIESAVSTGERDSSSDEGDGQTYEADTAPTGSSTSTRGGGQPGDSPTIPTPSPALAYDTVSPTPGPAVHRSPGVNSLDEPHQPLICPRIRSLLAHLHVADLERSEALQADLLTLTGWSTRTLAERLNDAVESSTVLGEFLTHIRRSVEARPHVLLAYGWVLYMALFSGGRFIRAMLENTDAEFWVPACESSSSAALQSATTAHRHHPHHLNPQQRRSSLAIPLFSSPFPPVLAVSSGKQHSSKAKVLGQSPDRKGQRSEEEEEKQKVGNNPDQTKRGEGVKTLPFRFFHFDTASDGEDLKQTFKKRLAESSRSLLSDAEREDVVQEARCIFEFMVRLVGDLDAACGTDREAETELFRDVGTGSGNARGMVTKADEDEDEDGDDDDDDDDDDGDGGPKRPGCARSRHLHLLSLRSRDSVVVGKEREKRRIAADLAARMSEGTDRDDASEGGEEKLPDPDRISATAGWIRMRKTDVKDGADDPAETGVRFYVSRREGDVD